MFTVALKNAVCQRERGRESCSCSGCRLRCEACAYITTSDVDVENSLSFAPFTPAIKAGTVVFLPPVSPIGLFLPCLRRSSASDGTLPCFLFTALAPRIMRVCAALTYVMVSARRGSGGGGGAAKQEGEKRRGE